MAFRIGIDFGYGFSGIALLNDDNAVLDYRVLKHRTDLSDTLTKRRQLRAARRRNKAKRQRLRDFYALLKGMDAEPANSRPGEIMTLADRMRLGNRLFALAHYRGWDYAELSAQLVILDDDKPPQLPPVVKEVDHLLLREYNAPACFDSKKSNKKKGQSDDAHKRAQQQAEDAVKHHNQNGGGKLTPEHLRFIDLQTPFLGELYRLEKAKFDLNKKDNKTAETEQEIEQLQDRIYDIRCRIGDDENNHAINEDNIKEWLRERLTAVYDGQLPPESDNIIDHVMVKLGLKTPKKLFDDGKIYRPHRNRHRNKMIEELEELMRHACGLENGKDAIFSRHYDKVLEERYRPKNAPPRAEFWACWQNDINRIKAQAVAIAAKRSAAENRTITEQDVAKRWVSSAISIVQHAYRKKRFNNRKIGKCPALCDGEKCGKNLPRKSRVDIRRLQCEIEARQMRIRDHDQKDRNMTDDEINQLMDDLRLPEKQLTRDDLKHNRERIKKIKTPPVKNDARGKKDILSDIVGGDQNGRTSLCKIHLQEKLNLLKDGIDNNIDAWQNLHQERILDLQDAPPSIRQKAERVVKELRQMLRRHHVSYAAVEHIGLETARFDISALASNEGKKMKAAQYQKSRSPIDRQGLANDQNGLCLLCGEPMVRNIHADHLLPKKRGGSNVRQNLVAMHDYCNINKGKQDVFVNQQALAALLKNNPKKGEAVKKQLGENLSVPKLDAPQHTMFGAKILKGALMNGLHISRTKANDIICRPRAADIAFLRRQWFPFMNEQKSALRAKNPNIKIIAGTKNQEENLSGFKLSDYLFGDGQTLAVKGGRGLVRLENDKLLISTEPTDAGVRGFFIHADNARVELTAYADDDDVTMPKKDWQMKGEIGENLVINIRDICPQEWQNFAPEVRSDDWLSLSADKKTLSGAPTLRSDKSYVVWPEVSFFDDEGELRGIVKLRVQKAQRRLSMAILPSSQDGIRVFHHALDAAVMAANIEWDAIMRMHRDVDARGFVDRQKMRQTIAGKPLFSAATMAKIGDDDVMAPPNIEDYYVKDALRQGKLSTQKYDTEPLRLRDGKLSQRIPLPNLSKNNVRYIVSQTIRTAMENLWQDIDAMTEEKKKQAVGGSGNAQCILQSYFVQLPREHPLHPHRVRSARCHRMAGNSPDSFEPLVGERNKHDRRKNAEHYFRRVETWAKAEVYENDQGQKTVHRAKNPFYWSDKNAPEFDCEPPAGARLVVSYERGDKVKVATGRVRAGVWEITKLGRSATLEPQCTAARAENNGNTITCVYHNLAKC